MRKTTLLLILLISTGLNSQNSIFDHCRNGNVSEIEKLHNQNPSIINLKNDYGYTPIMLAAYHGKENVVAFLLDKDVAINECSDYGTPLMAAVVKGHFNIAQLLLEKKANPNISDIKGTTALHYATMFQNLEIIKLLVTAGADVNLKNNVGKTPMDFGLASNNNDLINILKNY
ncbi:ankyrin repeat domain-containing protein [Seonamhaeicola maritimus]|uniref:Ankyrin repeat domain-containing protein n=1 Tax=Seonamhaeicola maritimus TaxID=2591822 RepID=A0A5C7GLX2_9FLAO|nr:ankyrin repeat domain-containing protein [Seonamhaeicola maritimus]TXG39332.1 ankyrin repeat domain-containing protein [Seonamhaeicola maritimus]